ncbi:uncharacterized protein FPRO_15826 [Fusarium proliferatum ET1]|uniref:PD-(D/E)XK nuclease-like domain-containing protein n=1 Tax=Fusarium proliferatum (strain ET1) TaxID=1227346 RepID=A0A1L7WA15_FUSPR|nr:uncharacterized protein FPRO_15826 [Fusarium proliferatum ET1]CZR49466.1 uncharacterized protein FPRO_15826 [Fusarium proliferatum ET1]
MNASVTPEYHKFPISPSKVDYCIFINPEFDRDGGVPQAADKLQVSCNGTVNHTSYSGLTEFPVCVSIETKRHGGDQRRADVQTATWHASQWTFLESHAGDGISELPFLPGIIVQGHEWKFVATTRRGNEMSTVAVVTSHTLTCIDFLEYFPVRKHDNACWGFPNYGWPSSAAQMGKGYILAVV